MKKIPCTCPKGGMYEMENGGTQICKRCDGTEWVTPPNERHKYWCKNCENKWKSEEAICPRCESREVLIDEPEIKPLPRLPTPHGEDWKEILDKNYTRWHVDDIVLLVETEIQKAYERGRNSLKSIGVPEVFAFESGQSDERDRILKLIEDKIRILSPLRSMSATYQVEVLQEVLASIKSKEV